MFIRKKKNKSGSVSVQILSKENGRNKLVETIGCSSDINEVSRFVLQGESRIEELTPQLSLQLKSQADQVVLDFMKRQMPRVYSSGVEKLLGKIFDDIGFDKIKYDLFRSIVLARLVYPGSKLKTTEYFLYHKNEELEVTKLYRFLDKFHKELKPQAEEIVYAHTKKILKEIVVVFYDVTTLYFEAEDEDDLRKIGYSKDGKFQHPQILLGLLVSENAYPIGYDIFEGNTFEGKTLLPILQAVEAKYGLPKPMVIADSGLLSKSNIELLKRNNYQFIIGARIKNESEEIKTELLEKACKLKDNECFVINKSNDIRLVTHYSRTRAKKDAHNRDRGIKKLEKQIQSGKLTKRSINNRGYNKFLLLESEINVRLDESKIINDSKWDGLKGYLTNSTLSSNQVINNYKHLWQIEKAFRIAKTDLRIRPIYHRKKDRIESHICIAFVAYTIFKELERRLLVNKINISPTKAITLAKYIYEIEFLLPDSLTPVRVFSKLSQMQEVKKML
jgi:transposase